MGRSQTLPQTVYIGADCLPSRTWRSCPPYRLDQLGERGMAVLPQQERRKDRALLRGSQFDLCRAALGTHWAQHREPEVFAHLGTVPSRSPPRFVSGGGYGAADPPEQAMRQRCVRVARAQPLRHSRVEIGGSCLRPGALEARKPSRSGTRHGQSLAADNRCRSRNEWPGRAASAIAQQRPASPQAGPANAPAAAAVRATHRFPMCSRQVDDVPGVDVTTRWWRIESHPSGRRSGPGTAFRPGPTRVCGSGHLRPKALVMVCCTAFPRSSAAVARTVT